MWFDALILVAALAGGAVAGVTGFGIGSLLTPALALQVDARLAVAAVSIPHIVGTAFRFWLLGGRVDRRVLWSFGLTSAAGGLTGALLQEQFTAPWLFVVFGALLLFTAAAEMTGLAQRMRFTGPAAWAAGAVSGLLGGLVGNQGGIRSAALLGIDRSRDAGRRRRNRVRASDTRPSSRTVVQADRRACARRAGRGDAGAWNIRSMNGT